MWQQKQTNKKNSTYISFKYTQPNKLAINILIQCARYNTRRRRPVVFYGMLVGSLKNGVEALLYVRAQPGSFRY
jgi:hypothetical protein